jgi:hypothetical protein
MDFLILHPAVRDRQEAGSNGGDGAFRGAERHLQVCGPGPE